MRRGRGLRCWRSLRCGCRRGRGLRRRSRGGPLHHLAELVHEPERRSDRLEGIGHGGHGGRLSLQLGERTTHVTEGGLGVRRKLCPLRALNLVKRPHGLRDGLGDVENVRRNVRVGLKRREAFRQGFSG